MTEVGPNIDPSRVSKWEAFFQGTEYMQKIREVADLYPEVRSVNVGYDDLDRFDADLAAGLLEHPDLYLLAGKQAMKNLMHQDMMKADIAVRIEKLPRDAKVKINDFRGRSLGKMVSFEALVTRAQQVKNNVLEGAFECQRCGHIVRHATEMGIFSEPLECYKEQDGCGRSSGTTRFRFLPDDDMTKTMDVQKIECQEPLENNRGGTSPARVTVWLSGDIAGSVTAGNRVIINGIPRMAKGAEKPKSSIMDTEVEAISVEVQDQEFADIEVSDEEIKQFEEDAKRPELYSNLIQSIAPSIKGYEMEKGGMLLQQFGGVPKVLDDGGRLRGDIHILLIGDPGMAKSAMVRYMAGVAPRGVSASGKSSSAAGLTVAATKDGDWGEGRWTLEAGAMVLADQGFLAVDELDKMREEDLSAMHEGMEQQFIHVNKAGITATLPTHCSMLAAANPKFSRFEGERPLKDQIGLAASLLSRFDLIFSFQDRPNEKQDRDIAKHILQAHARGGALINRGEEGMAEILGDTGAISPFYPPEKLRKYVAYAKRFRPVLTEEARRAIEDHYVRIRKLDEGEGKTVPITPRQLEGYIRIAEASARMRLSSRVEDEDARRAIDLVQYYLGKLTGPNGEIDWICGFTQVERERKFVVQDIIKAAGTKGIIQSEVEKLAEAKGIGSKEVPGIIKGLKYSGAVMETRSERGPLLRWG
jgi:replicative DNA helicase Mcm